MAKSKAPTSYLLDELDEKRRVVSASTPSATKCSYGQYFTSSNIARFMAGLFVQRPEPDCRLLDAGAGMGVLSAAFLERCLADEFNFRSVKVDAFEIDKSLHGHLEETFGRYRAIFSFEGRIRGEDFISTASDSLAGDLFGSALPRYTHAILNPPYKKIRSDSAHRSALRRAGIETVNQYSAFVALALSLLEDGGQLVAIVPRSFCNGTYYRPFREYILNRSAIRGIHLFASRHRAFIDDGVLQENVIVNLERGAEQRVVQVSTSSDDTFEDFSTHEFSFERIVQSRDPERFIHVPMTPGLNAIEQSAAVCCALRDIGIDVSTGPVVDFRLREYLRDMPSVDTVPLLYPGHFKKWTAEWPNPELNKPNAIARRSDTEKWLFPNGNYCVVRRFSSKEERRRVVASVVDASRFPNVEMLGFENHLNIFHMNRRGLPVDLANGLAVFLNTTAVDENFRRFNGHTQVNATDLRLIQYPSKANLMALGRWAMQFETLTQSDIDAQFASLSA